MSLQTRITALAQAIGTDIKALQAADAEIMAILPSAGGSGTLTVLDERYSNVSLLLHGNGANNGTVIMDNAPVPSTVTLAGGVVTSTTQARFGDASLSFNGTSGYASVPASTAFQFGTGDFTIECWVYPTALGSLRCIVTNTSVANETNFYLGTNANGTFYLGTYFSTLATSTATLALNTWAHIAATRTGGIVRLFKDGVLTASAANSTNMSSNVAVVIGREATAAARYFAGYIDDLRITKGVARYTATFSPPVSAFPDAYSGMAGISVASAVVSGPTAARPVAPAAATVWFDLTLKKLYIYTGTAWAELAYVV